MARNGTKGRVSEEIETLTADGYKREKVVRIYMDDGNDWSYSVKTGKFTRPTPYMGEVNEWDLERDDKPLPKLTLPLTEGQRIVCRDGRLATVVVVRAETRGGEEYRTADILIDGATEPRKSALWLFNGKGNRYPNKSPKPWDAMADAED